MREALLLGLGLFAFLAAVPGALAADRLVAYPAPEGIARNNDFAVRARTPGGAWQELFPYNVKVDRRRAVHPGPVTQPARVFQP